MTDVEEKFLQYGVTSTLAAKAVEAGLSVSKIRTLSVANLTAQFGMEEVEAKALKRSVVRQTIDPEVVQALLERSSFVCSVCKGVKSHAYVIHHIVPYEESQDNSYNNLIVLCPSDHDLAHRGGLTLGLTPDQLRNTKRTWEAQVELIRVQKAARAIDIHESAIYFVNIRRIEELCLNLFQRIPNTSVMHRLKVKGILDDDGHFDQKFVQENLSGGHYLFDYINSGETYHYAEMLRKITEVIDFGDLSDAADHGWKTTKYLESSYAYFIGGVNGHTPEMPITNKTPPILLYHARKKIRIEWLVDPMFLMSNTSIGKMGGRNHFIVYCLVQNVSKNADSKQILVKAQPLLIGQPKLSINRKPAIAYIKEHEREQEFEKEFEKELRDELGEGEL